MTSVYAPPQAWPSPGTVLWVTSSGTPSPRPSSWRGWRTRPWIRRLSGTTLPASMVGAARRGGSRQYGLSVPAVQRRRKAQGRGRSAPSLAARRPGRRGVRTCLGVPRERSQSSQRRLSRGPRRAGRPGRRGAPPTNETSTSVPRLLWRRLLASAYVRNRRESFNRPGFMSRRGWRDSRLTASERSSSESGARPPRSTLPARTIMSKVRGIPASRARVQSSKAGRGSSTCGGEREDTDPFRKMSGSFPGRSPMREGRARCIASVSPDFLGIHRNPESILF